MARSSGDTLSLNNLAGATGNTQNSNVSLNAINGSAGTQVSLDDFGIDSVNTSYTNAYSYLVESTTETITLGVGGAGTKFASKIGNRADNMTWSVTGGSVISLTTNNGLSGVFTVGSMNPQSPSAQTVLQSVVSHNIAGTFNDGFNDHATNYNTAVSKTVYSVDSYDGNSADMCLLPNTPILMSNGSTKLAEDLEEGDVLKGWRMNGLGDDDEDVETYLDWNQSELGGEYTDVTVVDVIFSFAQKLYTFNNELTATFEHPLLIKSNEDGLYRFKEAGLIQKEDKLIKSDNGKLVEVEIDDITITQSTKEIVSINVETADTYISNGYVSHNKDEDNSHTDFSGPGAPSDLNYEVDTKTLSWTAPTADPDTIGITAYDVEISQDGGFTTVDYTYSEYSGTSISLQSVVANGTYFARVRAIESGLKSSYVTQGGNNSTFDHNN